MSYGINNTDHNDLSVAEETPAVPSTSTPQPLGSQPVDRTEIDVMCSNVNRVQRSLDRLLDMFMATQVTLQSNFPPFDFPQGHFQHPYADRPHPPSPHFPPPPHHHHRPPPHHPPPPSSAPPPPNDPNLHHTFPLDPNQTPQFAEPLKLKDVWFSGDSAHLLSFLRVIRDFLCQNQNFRSESWRVVWILQHFGYHPSEHKRTPSPVENWYNSLVIDNARQQGVMDMYADLDRQEFVLPTLSSAAALLDGLIAVFGNKFMRENAKRALAACKQRNLTIGEYNSQFKSLMYLVEDVEETRIEKYVLGLNPCIVRKFMCKQWMDCKTLDKRMEMALDAAAQLDVLAQLPPELTQSSTHHPLSSPQYVPRPPQQRMGRDPDAMEIDAA
ncbi:hypothetical protein PCASD_05161 [Puccinia coronata f. sp. avenae]|uniref:Retrotransposon gag domain-containing protein n=1 Tax=Puccinia coronata f. sp. avenae TaxID=200324 RepID=A0A2N5V3Q3_9BASI|nr:hypothetical protein PCASD_05161 [Puccinia coronata f. sp. avenae]